jgi:hypothetical protein
MPVMIQFEDGLSCPVVVCDWCRKQITDARMGGYFFESECREDGVMVPVVFIHKGRCDDRYSAKHGRLDSWQELCDLPTYLACNLKGAAL